MSPHFIHKFINNPTSNLPLAKGVNIRFEAALQTKRADCFKFDKTKCDLCKKISLLEVYFLNAQTCCKLFSGQRLSFYLVLRERCNL